MTFQKNDKIYLCFLENSGSTQLFPDSTPSGHIANWSFAKFDLIDSRIFLGKADGLCKIGKFDLFGQLQKADIVFECSLDELWMNDFVLYLVSTSANIICT